jgi:uncharacterized membrane protein YdjX (TVP38/TMEM64 family)
MIDPAENPPSTGAGAPSTRAASPDRKSGFSLGRLIPIAVLVLGLASFFLFDLDHYISLSAFREHHEAIAAWVAGAGATAWLVYILIYALATAISVPGATILTIIGGFLFGPVAGSISTVIGATIGATGIFLAARYAFADLLHERAAGAVAKMEAGFQKNALSYLLFLRLVPVFPFWLVNLVPAFLGVPLLTYVVGTFVGIIPGSIVYVLVGDGLGLLLNKGGDIDFGIIFEPRFILPILGLAALSLVPIFYNKYRNRSR